MWPDWASRQLEISPWTKMSVKLRASRSRMRAVSSLRVRIWRVGWRLNVRWLILSGQSSVVRSHVQKTIQHSGRARSNSRRIGTRRQVWDAREAKELEHTEP